MEPTAIILPAIAMFALTISTLLSLGLSRFFAVRRGEVSVKFYVNYREGRQPERLHILGRHVQNHFEVPPLFYAGIILTFVTGHVTLTALVAAWAFVALRGIHTFIHLGPNNVTVRFFCFGLGLIALTVLWANLLVGLMAWSA